MQPNVLITEIRTKEQSAGKHKLTLLTKDNLICSGHITQQDSCHLSPTSHRSTHTALRDLKKCEFDLQFHIGTALNTLPDHVAKYKIGLNILLLIIFVLFCSTNRQILESRYIYLKRGSHLPV